MSEIATILITAPMKKSDPTEYTYSWSTKAKNMAENLGYNVIFIEKDDTTYENVSKTLKENRIRLYTHFGHGCASSLQGNRECFITRKYYVDELICMAQSPYLEEREKFLKLISPLGQLSCPGICALEIDPCSPLCLFDTNVGLLKGTISLAVACHSAASLGKCSIKYGVETYIGEDDLLMFPVDTLNSQDMFGEVQLTMFKELLMGHSVQEAERATSELEDSYIRRFKQIKYIALPLLWNKLHRKVLGNQNALIYRN